MSTRGGQRGEHVVVLVDAYPHVFGGAQRLTLRLAGALAIAGYHPVVLTTGPGTFVDRLGDDDVDVEQIDVPASLGRYGRTTTGARRLYAVLALPLYWLRLWRALRRLHPDVVHVNDHRGALLAALPARAARRRVVWHVHSLEQHRALTWFGTRLAHRVLVPSAAVLESSPGLGARGTAVVVTNPGPSVAAPGRPATEPVVLTIGRLHPDKGFDVLLDAFPRVRAAVPTARLLIIGGPQEGTEDHVTALRAAAGVGELVGDVRDVVPWFAKARVYVQPSRTETFGLAAVEAMAHGLPVVATDVAGLRTVVDDGVTGTLVPPDDPSALADALVDVLVTPGRAEAFGAAAALHAAREFPPGRFVDEVLAVYAELGARAA